MIEGLSNGTVVLTTNSSHIMQYTEPELGSFATLVALSKLLSMSSASIV